MQNKDLVLKLKEIQELFGVELNNLAEEMLDDGFDEYDAQAVYEAKQSIENALSRCLDQFTVQKKMKMKI